MFCDQQYKDIFITMKNSSWTNTYDAEVSVSVIPGLCIYFILMAALVVIIIVVIKQSQAPSSTWTRSTVSTVTSPRSTSAVTPETASPTPPVCTALECRQSLSYPEPPESFLPHPLPRGRINRLYHKCICILWTLVGWIRGRRQDIGLMNCE